MVSRFHAAQDSATSGYQAALSELQAGRKTGHWIWWIFPQVAGLGTSEVSRRFALADYDEARDYASDPVLNERLRTAMRTVIDVLARYPELRLKDVMGYVDAKKLVSCATLFRQVSRAAEGVSGRPSELLDACNAILALGALEDLWPCLQTTEALARCTICGERASGPPVASSVAPTSYVCCDACQNNCMEAEFVLELLWCSQVDHSEDQQVSTMVGGKPYTWTEWVKLRHPTV